MHVVSRGRIKLANCDAVLRSVNASVISSHIKLRSVATFFNVGMEPKSGELHRVSSGNIYVSKVILFFQSSQPFSIYSNHLKEPSIEHVRVL